MRDQLIYVRNYIISKKYKWILKPIFFKIDPEKIHDEMMFFLEILGKFYITRKITSLLFNYQSPILEQKILGINFKNPVGLSAGFDKNATITDISPSLGFGFSEIGSVTGEKCEGNKKPRLWRLPQSKSLLVHYGLKNDGCEAIANRLKDKNLLIPVGINIAKTNCKETADTDKAVEDYFKAYKAFQNIGSYTTINISCPNAFGGQPFTDGQKLEKLLAKIFSIKKTKPIFIKISPDLNKQEIDAIIDVTLKFGIDGFICTNLTKNRDNERIIEKNLPVSGGLSGKVVEDLSLNLIRHVYARTGGKTLIIGVGGIFTAEDAYRKIKAGASLVELITGMIFEGPQLISDINLGLVKLLRADGHRNISEAVGKNK